MSKLELKAIDRLNQASISCQKYGVFHGGITLRKSSNTWAFFGHQLIVDALAACQSVIIPALEAEASNIDETENFIAIGNEQYETQRVLPPLPSPLKTISVVDSRSYVANCLQLLTRFRDKRLMYQQTKPIWWPQSIVFAKPAKVPSSYYEKFENKASSQWHKSLKHIIYYMHKETRQSFERNVDAQGWEDFCKK